NKLSKTLHRQCRRHARPPPRVLSPGASLDAVRTVLGAFAALPAAPDRAASRPPSAERVALARAPGDRVSGAAAARSDGDQGRAQRRQQRERRRLGDRRRATAEAAAAEVAAVAAVVR